MKRLMALLLLLWLVACVPVTVTQEGSVATITLKPGSDYYNVTLHALYATSNDPRCSPLGEDVACLLGDIAAGSSVSVQVVRVRQQAGEPWCSAFGYTQADEAITSYRPLLCPL